ncbi:hypothetical protein FOZ61_010981 [Perkinsus olseni]|uniref:Uncharacterized protein n=1 Tax=Perkinsus olseni TaxID=32597 RepID=A0A7J6KU10_PEROL|nr:hypothetical protein FOZ61_010981 [Perkinsus olseni]
MILLILTASIFCALFDLGLMVAKNFIIEAYISRWKMEMRSFSMGPPPAWLDDPPEDFLHLPPGSDEYANFSLSLMVQNNPYWLKVEVFSVNMMVFGHNLASFYAEGAAISEDGKLSLAQKVPLDSVYEGAYLCLRYLFSTEQLVPLEIYFEAEFSFFGHRNSCIMFTSFQCHHRTILEECNVDWATGDHTPKDTRKTPSLFRSLQISGASIGKAFLLMMLLILTASIFYAFFNLGLMVAEDFLIEAYISRWRMEMRSFSMGPPPAWLDDPPDDFLRLPPGSDEYANFSLSLVVENNPHWLMVEVFFLQIGVFDGTLAVFFTDGAAISEDGTLNLTTKTPLADVCEGAYLCLRYLSSTEQLVAFHVVLEAEFSLFGRRSNAVELSSWVTYNASVRDNYGDDHKLSPRGELMTQNHCEPFYSQGAYILRGTHPGEVIVSEENHSPKLEFIQLDTLSSDRKTSMR